MLLFFNRPVTNQSGRFTAFQILLVTSTLPISEDPYPSLPLSDLSTHENASDNQEDNLVGPRQNGSQDTNTSVDEEMVDASQDDEEKEETNYQVESDAMTEKPLDFPTNGEQAVVPNPQASEDVVDGGEKSLTVGN
eukprot:Gb_08768 [translate_table: standard]